MRKYLSFFTILLLSACSDNKPEQEKEKTPVKKEETVPSIDYKIIAKLPHDTTSFTQGLVFYKGQLYESTGSPEGVSYTRSVLGPVDLKTGKISVKAELDKNQFFGEGIVILNNKLYQLTYKNQIGFIYDVKTFRQTGRFVYQNKEGWGLTTDGSSLIMSDGTNVLTYLDPVSLKQTKTINVTNGGYAEDKLNELEYINGYIYANIWTKNYIVKIDPASGKTVGTIDLSEIVYDAESKHPESEVLNGIAYDSISKSIYVTGKLFPTIYQIEFTN
ncbi:MAG TPA: glutaminyl-peptide cyclotransferase [Bacteroidia bacterium]|jgi:glutamine cyclotransferase